MASDLAELKRLQKKDSIKIQKYSNWLKRLKTYLVDCMTAIGNALGVQLPPCGSSNDEDVEVHATQVGSGRGRHSGSRGSCRDPTFVTISGTGSVAPQEATDQVLTDIDAHEGTEILGSDHSGQRSGTLVLFPFNDNGSDP